MKKLILLLALLVLVPASVEAGLFGGDKCGPAPEPEPECYDCAENKPEVIVQLAPCAKKNKPYNYFDWHKVAEKTVSSGSYNWDTPAN